jgi:hypothetical protein
MGTNVDARALVVRANLELAERNQPKVVVFECEATRF